MYDNWKTTAPESDDAPEYGDDEPVEASEPVDEHWAFFFGPGSAS